MKREEAKEILRHWDDVAWLEYNEITCGQMFDALRNAEESLSSPWHKTSEELPPHFGDYLVVIKSQQFGRRCALKCWYGYPEDPFGDNPSKEWVLEDDEIVTHWMEIPELPKED